jgi:lysophospholipase L1-like esterase
MSSRFFFLCPLLLLCFSCHKRPQASETPAPLANERVLILGNSITQNGLYVSMMEYWLRTQYPDQTFDLISVGLSSETVSCLTEPIHPYPRPCLRERLSRTLNTVQPDIVIACYGMNDGIYHPQSPERMASYQAGIQTMLEKIVGEGAEAIILTPPMFDALPIRARLVGEDAPVFGYQTPFEGYDQVLESYSEWLLSRSDLRVIDLHEPMKAYVQARRETEPDFTLARDGIHPGPLGHWLMASAILTGLGVSVPADGVVASEAWMADSLFRMIDEKRQVRSQGWLEAIGYTRGEHVRRGNLDSLEIQVKEMEGGIQKRLPPKKKP